MSHLTNKIFLVGTWVVVVFGYLWLLQFAYEEEKSFCLFVLLAMAGNLAYDGLKAVYRYNPVYPSDAVAVIKYVAGFIVSLALSLASLLFGAALFQWQVVGELAGQLVASVGFLVSMTLGILLLVKAEKRFKLSAKPNN